MEFFKLLIHLIREPGELIAWGGYPALALVIFVETGLLFPFLPGDSLLVVAGLYARKGDLDLGVLCLLLTPMAILGDGVSYYLGSKIGPPLFSRPRSRFFRPEHVERARDFYDKHGGKAIILARFMPIVRTYVPVIAGVAQMPYRRFATFNVIGGASWVASMTLVGYLLGTMVPHIDKHIEKVIIVVVLISISPGLLEYWKARRAVRASAE